MTDDDRRDSEIMMKIWSSFAKTGNSGIKGVIDWPTWDEATNRYLCIVESLGPS